MLAIDKKVLYANMHDKTIYTYFYDQVMFFDDLNILPAKFVACKTNISNTTAVWNKKQVSVFSVVADIMDQFGSWIAVSSASWTNLYGWIFTSEISSF